MKIFNTKNELSLHLSSARNSGGSIGLVPTMGALHEGHCSLLIRAVEENSCSVVSIFVNPTQFNDPRDLEKYPRSPEKDLEMLRSHGADVVFMPSVNEMYPQEDSREFDMGGLDKTMEGADRPGHFNGVAQIVSKLFEAVVPHRAYFGEKDFQQLAVVKHITRQLTLDIDIVPCPIIRESDGLAMSSRNARLSPSDRALAPFIYRSLQDAASLQSFHTPGEIREKVQEAYASRAELELCYYEIVNEESLQVVSDWNEPGGKLACIAVMLGGIRLIDNLKFA